MLFQLKDDILSVRIPERRMAYELKDFTEQAQAEIDDIIKEGKVNGVDLKIAGHLPTAITMLIGRDIAPLCKSISVFDMRTKTFIKCIEN